MPRVLNKYKHGIPEGSVYIGRGSKWGNKFPITQDHTREFVIEAYRNDIKDKHQQIRDELRGKDLVCFCSPKACHGDILLEIANAPD